jgi:hypothetical protein
MLSGKWIFREREMEFYFNKMFPMSSRFDWRFLIGYIVITMANGFLILWHV